MKQTLAHLRFTTKINAWQVLHPGEVFSYLDFISSSYQNHPPASSIMSLTNFVRKARATTKTLLGDKYLEEVTSNPVAPEPPKDISAYTEARLKEGLLYADQTLRNKKRKVSPGAQHCLTMYQCAIKDVLAQDYDNEEERTLLLRNLFTWEKDIYTRNFFRHPNQDEQLDLVNKLAELKRYAFAARYGDYFSRVCSTLKHNAKEEKTAYFEQLHGWQRFWTDINDDINKEHPSWRKWELRDPGVKDDDVKTTLAVYNACNTMSLIFEQTLYTIAMYADRNRLVHSSIINMVSSGQWHTLKDTLIQDLRDLPLVTPRHLAGNIPLFQEIIQSVVDEFFDRNPSQPDNANYWTPRDEAIDDAAKMADRSAKKFEKEQEIRKRISDRAAKESKKLLKEYTLVHAGATAAGLDPPTGDISAHRPSKHNLRVTTARMDSYTRQKKAWDKMINLQDHCHQTMKNYRDQWNKLEGPIDPRTWLDLDE